MKKYLLGTFVAGVLVIGLITTNNVSTSNDITLRNLSALSSSAGEMLCDQSNEVACTIEYDGAIGRSKGYLRVFF